MQIAKLGDIQAIGFDIDGTLYRPWRLHLRLAPHFFRWNQFFLKYGMVRHSLHGSEKIENFYAEQARRLAEKIGCTQRVAEERLRRIVYKGLGEFFKKIPCRANVAETFRRFHDAGFKLALLSDFPPEQKGELWGIRPYCDVLLGTEETGALKPSAHPFLVMAEKLGVAPERILYVGNSVKYDVRGAKSAGMKTAYAESLVDALLRRKCREADISFSSYRELQKIVLGS